jgi:hypothetical protein
MSTRRAHPAVTFFGTLISRSFSFVCLFHQSVHFLFIVSAFICLSFHFRVSFRFHFEFSFVETVPASWNNTRWPQNFGLRWLYASRLSSCGLSFYRSLFSSFSFPFPSIPLFFFSASITVRQSQFCFPFVPVICRNVIFFSPFPQPSSFVRVCVQPMRSCGKWPLPSIVRYDARTHRDFSATSSVNFPVGEIQCKQTGAMIVHLSF